jgi:hypothetical protein
LPLGLHGVVSQYIGLFITTAMRTSNPTQLYKMILFGEVNIITASLHASRLYPPVSEKDKNNSV